MTVFLALAAVLTLATLAVLLRPLWRGARSVAICVAVLAIASTALLYQMVGTPRALDAASLRAPDTLAEAIAQLEAELQRNPDQAQGWELLAQAYQREDNVAKARDAYARAVQLSPENAGPIRPRTSALLMICVATAGALAGSPSVS